MGVMAGSMLGSPVRRSKRLPWAQHSIWQPSMSPSERETSAWVQVSSIAKSSPSSARTTANACLPPAATARSARRAEPGARSFALQATCSLMGHPQLSVDGAHQALLDVGHADLRDEVGEEAAHDHPSRLVLRNAPGLEVEHLLIVEPAGRRRVAGARDLARLDFEVRHGVGARALREEQIAVELVGVGALRRGADQ